MQFVQPVLYFCSPDRPTTTVENATTTRPPIEGTSYTLTCDTLDEGNMSDNLSYAWFFNGSLLLENDRSVITIPSLQRYNDSGKYMCSAENVPGMGQPGNAMDLKVWCKSSLAHLVTKETPCMLLLFSKIFF